MEPGVVMVRLIVMMILTKGTACQEPLQSQFVQISFSAKMVCAFLSFGNVMDNLIVQIAVMKKTVQNFPNTLAVASLVATAQTPAFH